MTREKRRMEELRDAVIWLGRGVGKPFLTSAVEHYRAYLTGLMAIEDKEYIECVEDDNN